MEQFQIIRTCLMYERCNLLCIELRIICTVDTMTKLFFCEVCQHQLHNLICNLTVIHLGKLFQALVKCRNCIRYK